VVVRNRGQGPVGVLLDIEARIAEGQSIEEAIDKQEIANFMGRYKEAVGTARDSLNASAPIVQRP